MTPPIPLAQAQAQLLALARPLGSETVPAEQSLGRFLTADLTALRTQPSADLSAMDGYAVTAPLDGPWQIVGESAAGHPFSGTLNSGQSVRISTGAIVPHGAQAILLQEDAVRSADRLAAAANEQAAARHIRRRGFDFASGQCVLQAGRRIGPAQLALALAAGHGGRSLTVGRLPRVAALETGDELVTGSADWQDHQLPATNGAMIAALATPLATTVERLGPVADTMDALLAALTRAEDADVIVTTGGASVGDHDLVRPALEAWGARIDFWRVAMKPGKPLLIARRGEQWVIGLPGNPVSSYVTAFLFLLPLLRRLAGAEAPLPPLIPMRSAVALPAGGTRLELIRARLEGGLLIPLEQQDSSGLHALAFADALIERPIGAAAVAAGGEVGAYLLAPAGMA
jgi:molybdopterin molybdotransferase